MPDTAVAIDRLTSTNRPAERPIGFQRWSDLLFIHWRVSPREIQDLLPSRLSVDTYDGSAWVGLVLFHMSGVRPWWFIPVPWI